MRADKVTKYHMEAPLNTVMFQWLMNPKTYAAMSPAQQKVTSREIMPEVGNDKNATVERGGFSAVQNALIGPFRHMPRCTPTSAFGLLRKSRSEVLEHHRDKWLTVTTGRAFNTLFRSPER